MVGAQGIEFRQPLETSAPLQNVIARIRQAIEPMREDRYMAHDMEAAARLVRDRAVLECLPRDMLPAIRAG
jgi:histidine ammonia-lyase